MTVENTNKLGIHREYFNKINKFKRRKNPVQSLRKNTMYPGEIQLKQHPTIILLYSMQP